MPEQIHCPSCHATLRVPDALLGKNVKCPKCQTTFIASADAPTQPEGIVNEPSRASRRPSRPPEEDEAPPPEEEYEDEDRPRRRRGGRVSTEAAAAAVTGPAIALMVVGGLDAAYYILTMLLHILGVGLLAANPKGGAGPQQTDLVVQMVGGIGGSIFGLCWAALLIVGAVKMKSLSSYGLALTSCIMGMVPCHVCCILGIPFGIWGLVMLNNPEVKAAFARNR